MKTVDITVTAREGGREGEKVKAKLTVCEECGRESWLIFTIEGHDHPHLQCASCGTSYCEKDKCS